MGMIKARRKSLYLDILEVAGRGSWVLILYHTGGYKVEHKDIVGSLRLADGDRVLPIGNEQEWVEYIKGKSDDYLDSYGKSNKKKKAEILAGVHLWLADRIIDSYGWM